MNKRPQNYGAVSITPEVQFAGSSSSELNSLCDNVVTNIYTINTSWKTLDNAFKSLGTSRDNQGLRDKIHVTQLSANQIVSATSTSLHKLYILVRKSDKQQKLQVEKLAENFKEALAKYSAMQKQVANKMKANLLVIASIESVADEPGLQQQVQLSRELAFDQDLLLERETRVRQIEADILDVNQIMKDLSVLVHQQAETVDTIENSIEHATGNVEDGAAELVKASRYQNKIRRKLCFLVVVALIIISALIAFLVYELKR